MKNLWSVLTTGPLVHWISKTRFINKNDAAADANETAQTNFYNTVTANYSADYGQFEGATQNLMAKLQPIVNAGPGQYGYDATEDAAIRGSAINADAASTQNAVQAANQQITASNGGSAVMPTGAQEQLRQEADIAGAQKLSSDMNSITQAGYAQGTQNYDTALSAEGSTLGLLNPNSYASAASGAGSSATSAVNAATNAQEASTSWMSFVGGALGGAGSALGGYLSKGSTGSSSYGIPAAQAPYGPNSD